VPASHQAPKGTLDILPPGDGGAPFDSTAFAAVVARFAELVEQAGFGLIVGPMFEDLAVYARVGATTDIVRKEMYDFRDKSDRELALRPDSTPSVVRAFIEHRPIPPWKVWYVAPHFRYDQPQAGRYRQHHSVGVEVLGVEDADIDAELISLASRFLREEVGLSELRLLVNSIGDPVCRPAYRDLLLAYLDERRDELCDEHKAHYRDNPMRVLDCKRTACHRATIAAPRLLDHLCDPCERHFATVRRYLDAEQVPYEIDTRLVRGQDYYTRTTFEFEGTALSSAQLALGGGGRYDGLVEAFGGPATPGIGFGLGIERILLTAQAEGVVLGAAAGQGLDVFVIDQTGEEAYTVVAQLRRAGLRTDRAYGTRSFKAQMKQAMRSTAALVLLIEDSGWTIRTLQEKGEPVLVDPASAIDELRKRLQS